MTSILSEDLIDICNTDLYQSSYCKKLDINIDKNSQHHLM